MAYPCFSRPFLETWAGRFEAAFVLLHPFARISGQNPFDDGRTASRFGKSAAYLNTPSLIYQGGALELDEVEAGSVIEQLSWREVARRAGLEDIRRLNGALRTVIAALSNPRKSDAAALIALAEAEGLFLPSEGYLQPLHGPALQNLFERIGVAQVIWQPEFDHDPCEILHTAGLGEDIGLRGSLYDFDRSTLVTVEWDSFFTVVAGDRSRLEDWVLAWRLDGFFADATTGHSWGNAAP